MKEDLLPKTISVFREGYDAARLKADALAGLTVAIVALPLSMAIAIASGVTPDRGLYTAIVGGFIVSALGGSRHQIGGPAGAFIVLVAATVSRHDIDGLLLATAMAGLMLLTAGLLRLGDYIKFIPYPVTIGFTAGIAVIIFASQIGELLGLAFPAGEPGPLIDKIPAIAAALPEFSPSAAAIAVLTVAIILLIRRLRPTWPGLLIAVFTASVAAALLSLPVSTIGSKFGGIPSGLPLPSLPHISTDLTLAVLPDAIAFALLGAIESLLSAVVADGMTGRRHRSNTELVAQGIANIGSALFGGICVTGTIARTATNVRAGATSPVSGMLHSLFMLAFMLVAAPLAAYIPLSSLAGVLAVVSWNMVERSAILTLIRSSRGETLVLAVTFLLVIFRDLTEGILVGVSLAALQFIHHMSKGLRVTTQPEELPLDNSDARTVIYRLDGAFFFGAVATASTVLDRIGDDHRNLVLDCTGIQFIDTSGANLLAGVIRKAQHGGVKVYVVSDRPDVRLMLCHHELHMQDIVFTSTLSQAQWAIRGNRI
ncbi:SulP family sulfate transporter [Rhizobium sp. Root274]|uniref:SulP family inorganic anion transporter n=1 Tax=unclassified Rhizobium TaxID=2613769 RepID=UPI0007161FE0|nr:MULTISPECIES: SulP family inorganic anion transporter [unclassified Rhizobium]KQW28690.1 SulP family sulfate transporter [Rhizobium sp. Root1240]KRD28888.1 SulP family sulfate transporter [Rhizobium sp. Root274]